MQRVDWGDKKKQQSHMRFEWMKKKLINIINFDPDFKEVMTCSPHTIY